MHHSLFVVECTPSIASLGKTNLCYIFTFHFSADEWKPCLSNQYPDLSSQHSLYLSALTQNLARQNWTPCSDSKDGYIFSPLWNILEDTGLTPSSQWQLLGWSFSTAMEIWEDALCVVGILGWATHPLFLHKGVRDARADVYQITGAVSQLEKNVQ